MQFLVAIHLPDDYDSSKEDSELMKNISDLNEEMIAKGVRVFVGGLQTATRAKTIRARNNGGMVVTDGPFVEAKEHVGGFWVLECADIDEAVEWGKKATVACRAPVEVREFMGAPPERLKVRAEAEARAGL
ncbi:MAG: YciI family protein [Devosia sp.]